MAQVELECAVYGEGTVFPVKIARDAKVSALQKTIFDDQRYHERFSFPPSSLTLYLARKKEGEESKWLKDDDNLDALLRDVNTLYMKMRPSWRLNKEELFGLSFTPGDEEIHVLVELPEAAAGIGSENSAMAQMAKDVREVHEQVVQTKRKRYVHSEMSSNKGNALLQDLNIRLRAARSVPFAAGDPTPAEAFKWETISSVHGQEIVLTEEQQRERYRAYVEVNIGDVLARKRLCVLGVEKGKNILTALVPGHNIELAGRADLLILSDLVKEHPLHLELLPDVKMLIEVKRTVKGGAVFQALSELIALDVLVDEPVMALLTDLTSHWQFFWISERSNNHVNIRTVIITDPSAAFAVIKTLLAQSPTADAEIRLPWVEEPVKRRKLVQLLPSISEGGGGSGIRESIERYYDVASMLGPDVEMARAVANQVVRSIPVLSYFS
uniref:Crinkler effector protein N-terminal domain-containing protein n=1 Tax=Globisporangium ultimum (strain ATCC 200006 / CBS 805.95 / DAOM BR144) TaxID=431595 RepID=K3X352_GLOUD